ncbi:hypothetical protein XENORESO_014829 [Xenotaenia resolanae]|uniref:Uncharacterized protein n=1 Tax=Xenotaenia resolanae TaxID=208358 RepID=A0ABV0W3N5_9TELE
MRPRSRLLSKRRVMLPTIREGMEEMVKDLNEANAFHFADNSQGVHSEDYFLSICHLARPTFPTRDVFSQNYQARQQEAVQQRLIGSALSHGSDFLQMEEKKLTGELLCCNSDPLEYLYGNQKNLLALSGRVRKAFVEGRMVGQQSDIVEGQARRRANSIPHTSNTDLPFQHTSNCTEILSEANTSAASCSPRHSSPTSETRRVCLVDKGAEGERLNPVTQQSLISQWISDCRSAWREARLRACMLPAIAEV